MNIKKKSELIEFFNQLNSKIKQNKITGVFSLNPFYHTNYGYESMLDLPLFIIFEDSNCLIIDYPFINSLSIEYRPMNEEEQKVYQDNEHRDLFNTEFRIHEMRGSDYVYKYTEKVEFQYGKIVDIEVVSVTEEYSAWIDGSLIDSVKPTEETFNDIIFTLDSGKKFIVSAEGAEVDGYTSLYTEDAKITRFV